jgi:hypothetical protein
MEIVVQAATIREDLSLTAFDEHSRYPTEAEALKTVAAVRGSSHVFRVLSLDELILVTNEETAPFDPLPETLDG